MPDPFTADTINQYRILNPGRTGIQSRFHFGFVDSGHCRCQNALKGNAGKCGQGK
jgi:hypothetical protein